MDKEYYNSFKSEAVHQYPNSHRNLGKRLNKSALKCTRDIKRKSAKFYGVTLVRCSSPYIKERFFIMFKTWRKFLLEDW